MKKSTNHTFKLALASVGLLFIVPLSACGPPSVGSPSETPRPTTPAALRKISPPPAITSTSSVESLTDNFVDGIYTHPSGAFSFQPPEGWEEDTGEFGSVFFSEPAGEGAIYSTVTNTGNPLSYAQFQTFVLAREENFFSGFDMYAQISLDWNEDDQSAIVHKSLLYEDMPEEVLSYYFLEQNGVFSTDTWMESDRVDEYQPIYQTLMDSYVFYVGRSEDFPYYNFVITFYDTLDAFSFEAPVCWPYESRVVDGAILDIFSSPDQNAQLIHVMFSGASKLDEGELEQKIFQAAFGELAATPEQAVAQEWEQNEDGYIHILWQADESEWQKETLYMLFGDKVMALNGVARKGFEQFFQSTIDYGFDWYSVPAEGSG